MVALFSFTGPLGISILSSTILRTPDKYTLPIGLYNPVAQKMGAATPPTRRGGADRRTGGDPLSGVTKYFVLRPDLGKSTKG